MIVRAWFGQLRSAMFQDYGDVSRLWHGHGPVQCVLGCNFLQAAQGNHTNQVTHILYATFLVLVVSFCSQTTSALCQDVPALFLETANAWAARAV